MKSSVKQTNLKTCSFQTLKCKVETLGAIFINSAYRVALLTRAKTLSNKGEGACCREGLLVRPGHLASLSTK